MILKYFSLNKARPSNGAFEDAEVGFIDLESDEVVVASRMNRTQRQL